MDTEDFQNTLAVTVDEVANAMGVSRNSIYNAAALGELPFPVYRLGKRYVIPRAQAEAAMGAPIPRLDKATGITIGEEAA